MIAVVCDDGEGNSRTDCEVKVQEATARAAWEAARALGWKRKGGQHVCPVCLYGQEVEG